MRPSKMEGALPPKESKGLLTAWRGHDLGQISNIIFYEVGIFPVKRYVMSLGDWGEFLFAFQKLLGICTGKTALNISFCCSAVSVGHVIDNKY